MRKMSLLVIVLFALPIFAQEDTEAKSFQFFGGIGADYMSDTLWFNLTLQPELGLGPIGFGLDIPLRVSSKGRFRSEDWDSPTDIFGKIRYLRVGYANSPLYLKVGVLDHTVIGDGFIMDNYSNTLDENARKSGVILASDLGKFGSKILYSNLAKPEIVGTRVFIRPIRFIAPIPILSNLEAGVSYIADLNPDNNDTTNGALGFTGFDIGLPIISTGMLSIRFYADYAKITNYGSGFGAGGRVDFNFIMNILRFSAKFEKRILSDQFIPSYFDPLYEAQKVGKEALLSSYHGDFDGYYGELTGTVFGRLSLGGNYQYYHNMANSGKIHLTLDGTKFIEDMPVLVMYDKSGIESIKNVFNIDENTIYTISISKKIFLRLYGTVTLQRKFQYNETKRTYDPLNKYSFMLGVKL